MQKSVILFFCISKSKKTNLEDLFNYLQNMSKKLLIMQIYKVKHNNMIKLHVYTYFQTGIL